MARMVALTFNWWSILTRMAAGSKHEEAITTWLLFQYGVARRTRHAKQTQLSISSRHGKAKKIAYLLSGISSWMQAVMVCAEQLAERAHWPSIVKRVFQDLAGFPWSRLGS